MSYYIKTDRAESAIYDRDGNETNRIHELDLLEMYDDMLDDCHEEIRIGTLAFLPSRVLKETDPIAYRCSFLEYIDSLGLDEE